MSGLSNVPNGSVLPSAELPDDERRSHRNRVLKAGTICVSGRQITIPCTVRDMTENGSRIKVSQAAVVPDTFELNVELDGIWVDCAVRWREGEQVGLRFVGPIIRTAPARTQVISMPAKPASLRRTPR